MDLNKWTNTIVGAVVGAILTLAVQSRLQEQDASRRERDSALNRLQARQVALHSELVRIGDKRWHLKFTNNCKKTAFIAIRHEDLLGNWVTHGWVVAKPGETVGTESFTTYPDFNWYADVPGETIAKDQSASTTRREVSSAQFTHMDGDVLVGGEPRYVYFIWAHISSPQWSDPVVPISCSEQ